MFWWKKVLFSGTQWESAWSLETVEWRLENAPEANIYTRLTTLRCCWRQVSTLQFFPSTPLGTHTVGQRGFGWADKCSCVFFCFCSNRSWQASDYTWESDHFRSVWAEWGGGFRPQELFLTCFFYNETENENISLFLLRDGPLKMCLGLLAWAKWEISNLGNSGAVLTVMSGWEW